MGIFDRLRKKQDIETVKEKSDHFSDRNEIQERRSVEKNSKEELPKTKGKKSSVQIQGSVLLRPIVTEKSTLDGTYTFAVAADANKSEIMKAIEKSYGVKPVSVRVMVMAGKKMRWSGVEGKRKDWKKAIIRLPEGKTINVFNV